VDDLQIVQKSIGQSAQRLLAPLFVVSGMLALACGSGSGKAPDTGTDTDSTTTTPDDTTPDTPGNLPNLSTHSQDPPAPDLPPEPADCEVLALGSCVTDALDELSSCLAAGHGGTFNADATRCELAEASAVVTFSQAVPRWSNAAALGFELAVNGQDCASYSETREGSGIAGSIVLTTAQHSVTLDTAADQRRTLTCDGVTLSFVQSNLSQCRESKPMPTPELMDSTQSGVFSVSPLMQSSSRIFNCQFPAPGP
jgi:hypothetical protein